MFGITISLTKSRSDRNFVEAPDFKHALNMTLQLVVDTVIYT